MAFVDTHSASAPAHQQLFICRVQNLRVSISAFVSSLEWQDLLADPTQQGWILLMDLHQNKHVGEN